MSNFGDHPAGFFGKSEFYNGAITQSARFGVNNVLTNEQDAPSDRKNFTLSMWFKRSRAGTEEALAGGTTDNANYVRFEASGAIRVRQYNTTVNLITNAVFRDTSAWYHLVVAWDLDNSTQADRVIIYVNGTRQTLATNTLPSNTSTDSNFNVDGGTLHIGAWYSGGVVGYYSGYIADVNFVDGTTLAPTAFGETKNGVWIPIKPAGLTYGNNGFRLQFKNSAVSTASSSTIGADTSGKNRHFTSAGIVASDCAMLDSPENNWCTINGIVNSPGTIAHSEGNLRSTQSGTNSSYILGTIPFRSGKWWMEVRVNAFNDNFAVAVARTDISQDSDGSSNDITNAAAGVVAMYQNGQGFVDGTSIAHGTFAPSGHDGNDVGDVIGVAIDLDSGTPNIRFFLDGTQTSITQELPASMLNTDLVFACLQYNGNTLHFNWGQDSTFGGNETATTNADANGIGEFHHAPPSGHLTLCTANLPEPTIGPNSSTQADDYFNTVLWTGNGADDRSISGVGFQPDFVWLKQRNGTNFHTIVDSSRGATKRLFTNANEDESTDADSLQAFESDGFQVGTTGSMNGNNNTFVAWNWLSNGGTTSTNNDGDIASTVQVNTTAGFSIVTFTANGSSTDTVGHGLSKQLSMVLIKSRAADRSWHIGHKNLPFNSASNSHNGYLSLDTNAANAPDNGGRANIPNATTFQGEGTNTHTMVAYCFHEVDGYSKFGKYTGNGDADGTFVYLGFRPAWVMVKRTDATNNWVINDTTRAPFNEITGGSSTLYADTNNKESDLSTDVDFLSNGFKAYTTGAHRNAAGLYIYMAFAEAPFKYSNAR